MHKNSSIQNRVWVTFPRGLKLIFLLLLMVPVIGTSALADDVELAVVEDSQPLIKVSPKTTHLTGPLDDNGDVDFFLAVEQRRSQGITAENNAIVPLVEALGSTAAGLKLPESFFKKIGIAPPVNEAEDNLENEER